MPAELPRPADRSRAVRPWPVLVGAALLLGVLVAFPPFRIVNLRHPPAPAAAAAAGFEPAGFAARFWTEQLQPAAAQASEIGPVLQALLRDPAAAAEAHARRVGLGSSAYYFVRGAGRITGVESSRVLVGIDGTTVAVRTGPVFGNAVRDGTGLLDVNDVPGLAEYNALAAELNRLVEQHVQPRLADAAVGATLHFAGVAAAPESLPAQGPALMIVPVQAEVLP